MSSAVEANFDPAARPSPGTPPHRGTPAMNDASPSAGLWYGLAAYGLWGLVPLYVRALAAVPPGEILAHRIVWSAVFLSLLLAAFGRVGIARAALRAPRTLLLLAASTLLIG